ncbi:hypothetical protein R3W88_024145 [Solanum pinnatisectum]|uniref:RNase H type-1 domain-containing protein n=1 Tax=Solanum pinnatisectum TaxID=50273 RepID=A0AAV9M3A5_9SOLN|nr:hypothetical protein R3W88_024145 [Solanum pinnatisectum]
MQYIRLPTEITKKIDQIQRNFIWGSIWLNRNENYHNNKRGKTNANISYIHAIEFFSLTNQRTNIEKPIVGYVKWKPPNIGFKLNTDGSTSTKSGTSGIGVIRDKYSNWVVAFMGNIYEATNIVSELLALQKGLTIALTYNLTPLEINVGCQDITV